MKKCFTLKLMLCLSWVLLCCLILFNCPAYATDNNSGESVNAFIKDGAIDGFMLPEQSMSTAAGCPADYPIDCGNGYCCPSGFPVCGTGANADKCSTGGCPADYPIDCGNGYCCPSSNPVCGTGANVGKCGTDGGGCPADYPIDCKNGYCCPSNYPVCGTGANEGKCGTGGGPACVAETILQDDEECLNVLRDFRDKILLKTEKGERLVELYYEYSPILIKLIKDKPELKAKLKQRIKTLIPGIKKAL
jgi:hypothetical protein